MSRLKSETSVLSSYNETKTDIDLKKYKVLVKIMKDVSMKVSNCVNYNSCRIQVLALRKKYSLTHAYDS